MFTTSRYASPKARELARRMAVEAGEIFMSRGKHTIDQLAEMARRKGEEHISIIEESKGEPATIALIEVSETGKWRWTGKRPIGIKS